MNINAIQNYIPEIKLASPQQAVKNLTKIAVPVIALVAFTQMQAANGAHGSGSDYVDCFDTCNEHTEASPLAKFLCYAMCWLITSN